MLFICVLADIIHMVKILLTCNVFFSFRKREFRRYGCALMIAGAIMGTMSAIIYIYDNHIIETILYVITIILLLVMLYREKIGNIIIVTFCMLIALSMIDTMAFFLFDIVTELININGENVSNLVVSLITLALIYLVGKIYQKNNSNSLRSIGITNLIVFIVLLGIDTFVVTVIAPPNVDSYMANKRNIYLLAVVFVIIGIFIQLAAIILLFTQRNVYKEKETIADKYLNEQKRHYEYLENREKETKKFRHDLRSHMEIISNMVNNHEYESMNSYLEKMHMKIDTFGNLVTVQNGIVDAIINQYYTKAGQNNIKMDVKGRLPVDCAIDAFDLCTIFSNILSNAFEAAITTEEKYISLECRYNDKNIIIAVRNSYDNATQSQNNQWKTRKKDTDYHGYGLENIKDSVKKYNGIFDIETKDGMFNLTILFNNTH